MRSIAGENPNRDGKSRTLRAIERPRAESNRRERARFERRGKIITLIICRSPCPGEHATPRTFRGRVAVPTLTSGQQPVVKPKSNMKHSRGTAGSRTPRRGKNIPEKTSPVPFVPCPRALSQRGAGKFNYKLMNRKSRRAVESNHRNGQLKETAYTTGARHSRAASSRRDAGKHSVLDENKWSGARRLRLLTSLRFNYISNSIRRRVMPYSFEGFT